MLPCIAFTVAPGIGVLLPRTVIFPERVTVVVTLNVKPLLAFPPTVTTTGPVVAVAGIGTEIFVSLQLVGLAATPLNVIVLLP